jgi:dihydrofolate reductase
MSMSLDGFVAGADQGLNNPLGIGGEKLHRWLFPASEPRHEGDVPAYEHLSVRRGAYVMGRNMFGPVRGEWDRDWRGWWGDEPPYHAPVFVLTHYPHDPIEMAGGTTFHFVTDGIETALDQAREAAGDRDVRIAGGGETILEYVNALLIDEFSITLSPVLFGSGIRLFEGVDAARVALDPVRAESSPRATHLTYAVRER